MMDSGKDSLNRQKQVYNWSKAKKKKKKQNIFDDIKMNIVLPNIENFKTEIEYIRVATNKHKKLEI